MNGLLRHPPTDAELERLYHELALIGATSVGLKRPWGYRPRTKEDLIALASEMLRYDARLLSVLLQYLIANWSELNPIQLRAALRTMRWPQAMLVVLEFAKVATDDPEFRYFAEYVSAGFTRLEPAERFFMDAERPGSRVAQRTLGRNLQPYARWGFVGSEKPIADVATKRTVGRYDSETRRRILQELASNVADFTLADYLAAVDHAISRQQALLDLRHSPNLVSSGRGRGARWHVRVA